MSGLSVMGLVLLFASGVLLLCQRNQSSRAFCLKTAQAVTAVELGHTARYIAAELGDAPPHNYVKIWGKVSTPTSLRSPLRNAPCVHYETQVNRIYTTIVHSTNAEGNSTEHTEEVTSTIYQETRSIPFQVVDQTGAVEINPDGANIEAEQILDEFRPGHPPGGLLQYGRLSIVSSGDSSTVGYQYVESIVMVNRNLLVVGAVSHATGSPVIGNPAKSAKRRFMISYKNEQMMLAAATNAGRWLGFATVVCFGLGLVLLWL